MPSASELFDAPSPMASDLEQGVQTIALNQEIKFKLYGRVVLPIDGYVFWVRADLLKQPAFKNFTTAKDLFEDDETMDSDLGAPAEDYQVDATATGSLHYAVDVQQEEAETYARNRVIFTSKEEVGSLNEIAPDQLWIGTFPEGNLRFGFSSVSRRYMQAGLWHYSGFAVYPDMAPQIIDQVQDFSDAQIVSNSLPAWLALASYAPPNKFWGSLPTLFPSFLAPENETPPFATVHVIPEGTQALASAPTIDQATSTHTQLCSDNVRITLWGGTNKTAMDLLDAIYDYSGNVGAIGIMNVPAWRDEKRTQAEMAIIAKKKVIEFQVSYLQHQQRAIAEQVIRTAIPKYLIGG